jgi:hypothetical protein
VAAAMNPLADADLYDWIALRWVSGGGVAKLGDCWLDSGRRVPNYVAHALTELLVGGLVALAGRCQVVGCRGRCRVWEPGGKLLPGPGQAAVGRPTTSFQVAKRVVISCR